MTNREALNVIADMCNALQLHPNSRQGEAMMMAINSLKKGTPSAENKGEWILDYRDCGIEFYHCSRCNLGRAVIDGDYYKSLNEFKKCPICGVDMRKEQDGDK